MEFILTIQGYANISVQRELGEAARCGIWMDSNFWHFSLKKLNFTLKRMTDFCQYSTIEPCHVYPISNSFPIKSKVSGWISWDQHIKNLKSNKIPTKIMMKPKKWTIFMSLILSRRNSHNKRSCTEYTHHQTIRSIFFSSQSKWKSIVLGEIGLSSTNSSCVLFSFASPETAGYIFLY